MNSYIDSLDGSETDDTLGSNITIEPNIATNGGLIYEDYNLIGDITPTISGGMKIHTYGSDQRSGMELAMDSLDFNYEDAHMPWDENSHLIGTPYTDHEYWQPQTTDFTCAVQAQRGIIEAYTGQDVSESQLVYDAAINGWITNNGMNPRDVGNLLDLYGIPNHTNEGASIQDLMSELSQGRKVIVGVDSGELWKGEPLEDFFNQSADHAIWVTGIDMTNPNNPQVIINDSGDPSGAGKSYDLDQFVDAWEDSGFFYVATDNAPNGMNAGFRDQMASYLSNKRANMSGIDANIGNQLSDAHQDFASYIETLSDADMDKLLLNI
jgi:hypothetical protein